MINYEFFKVLLIVFKKLTCTSKCNYIYYLFLFAENKYPELCALCDNQATCSYNNKIKHGHFGALECLARRNGKVAYAALNYVREYFKVSERSVFRIRMYFISVSEITLYKDHRVNLFIFVYSLQLN